MIIVIHVLEEFVIVVIIVNIMNLFLNIIGFFIIFVIIDYKRDKTITSPFTIQGWVVMIMVILACFLINHKV